MKMKATIFAIITVFGAQCAYGQYAYNSSIYNQTPALFNVATVASGDNDFGFCTNFKMQYLTLNGTPLRTNALTGEFKISDGTMTKNHFGIGFNVVNEQTGDNRLMSTEVNLPFNYSLALGQRSNLSIGVSPGVVLQSYDPTLPNWETDWNGSAFNWANGDPIYINGTLSRSSYGAFNVNTGAFYQIQSRNKSKFYGGLAVNHLNKPKMNLTENSDKMYMQMLFHCGADISLRRKDVRIQPQLMAFKNGPSSNLIVGVNIENILASGSDYTNIVKSKTIGYGANYRWNDAVSVNFNVKFTNFKIGFALDANTSRLSSATGGLGSVEIFFRSMHLYGRKKTKVRNT